ncbi:MAG: class II fructose-bisphosphate aldolase [Candidatus Omnitrophota bacterium]|nr:MAG: class II fructose-bisphosphate aldolase [Candidatus Omnitrophota bacterium]
MLYRDVKDLLEKTSSAIRVSKEGVTIEDKARLKAKVIDELVYNLCLNENQAVKDASRWIIWGAAAELGIYPSSIQGLYEAKGKDKYSQITVPAVNIRGLTYDVARALIRTAMKLKSLNFVFEIARSEIGYTFQRPAEYAAICLGAAIKEGFSGPLFILGDHFQLKAKNYAADAAKEIDSAKELIREAIEGGFYNIDIDSSTLVDLDKKTLNEQQWNNYDVTAKLTSFIREIQPKDITVSVGGEIGEVGGKNTTPEEFRAFMEGYKKELNKNGKGSKGISKISIQTGTAHGGVVLPDGSIAKVSLDFDVLRKVSEIARHEYGLAGTVQHGASTLPDDAFHHFPQTETAEVHLATGFQNIVYESRYFPRDLRDKIYAWLKENCSADRKEGMSDEQFIYKTRKKGFGPFKKELMSLPEDVRNNIGKELEEKFTFIFQKLNAADTEALTRRYVKPVTIKKACPEGLIKAL